MAGSRSASVRAFMGRFFLALVLVFTLTAGGIGGAYWFANNKIDGIPSADIDPDVLYKAESGEPANFLIVGSDTRAFVNDAKEAENFGDEDTNPGQRSDTIMVAHVDPEAETGLLVSFPRDLWVNIPGLGEAKINAAFNEGPQRVIETLQQNFNIPIHHYLEIDFAGFKSLVDAVGSVPIFFPTAARDEKTGLVVPLPGCYHLTGTEALAYVRSRYYEYKETLDSDWEKDPTSDLGRIRRQQYFIRSLAQVAIETSIRNPIKANGILNKAVASLTKDEDLGFRDLSALANTFREVDPAVVEMLTVPSDGARRDGQSVQLLRQTEAEPIFQRLRSFSSQPETGEKPDIEPAEVSVKVLNGSGVTGQARLTLTALQSLGFEGIDPPEDADRSDYEVTELRYAPGADQKAALVQYYLGGVGKLVPLTQQQGGADVLLVLGSDFKGVEDASAPPASSADSTVTTAPASTTTTRPVPGTTPGVTAPSAGDPNAFPAVGC